MTDQIEAAPEAADEVVPTEVKETEAPEAAESTEGQVEDQPAEVETEETPEETEEKVSASKLRREKRKQFVAKLKADNEELEAEKRRLQDRLNEYEQYSQTPPPKQEDFTDYEDFTAAKAAYASAQVMDRREQDRLKREAETHQQREAHLHQQQEQAARENWAAQVEDAKERYADFDAVVSAPDLPITQDMARFLALSDSGADVAYYLGMNKAEARTIAQMPEQQRAGALAMLERLAPKATPKPRTQSQAPEPVTPVKPKATGMKSPDKMSMAEYAAARAAGKI